MGQACYGPRLGPMQGQPHHMGPGVSYLSNPPMRPGDPYGCNPVSYSPYPSSNGGSVYNGPEAKSSQPQQYYVSIVCKCSVEFSLTVERDYTIARIDEHFCLLINAFPVMMML